MKSIKILALALLMFVALPSCDKNKEGGKDSVSELQKNIVGEWQLTDWNGAAQPFDVYVDFNEDGSFEMYQRVYELNYVLYTGTYSISGDILT
ncbi:MAG: lipocalin family protein, partial [Alistipes sp.]|nr:lipocalin family protein [Alistipes sp.]